MYVGLILPRVGDRYPAAGRHASHEARVVGVDARGLHTYEAPDADALPPRVTVACSCGRSWTVEVPEALVAA